MESLWRHAFTGIHRYRRFDPLKSAGGDHPPKHRLASGLVGRLHVGVLSLCKSNLQALGVHGHHLDVSGVIVHRFRDLRLCGQPGLCSRSLLRTGEVEELLVFVVALTSEQVAKHHVVGLHEDHLAAMVDTQMLICTVCTIYQVKTVSGQPLMWHHKGPSPSRLILFVHLDGVMQASPIAPPQVVVASVSQQRFAVAIEVEMAGVVVGMAQSLGAEIEVQVALLRTVPSAAHYVVTRAG